VEPPRGEGGGGLYHRGESRVTRCMADAPQNGRSQTGPAVVVKIENYTQVREKGAGNLRGGLVNRRSQPQYVRCGDSSRRAVALRDFGLMFRGNGNPPGSCPAMFERLLLAFGVVELTRAVVA